MRYRHGSPVAYNNNMTHIKQILFWGTVLGLIAVLGMYLVLLKAETEIRLEGTNTTNEPRKIEPKL